MNEVYTPKIIPERPLGGNHWAWDIGYNTIYGYYDLDNGLIRLRQAYTNRETVLSAPSRTELERDLQRAAGEALKRLKL